MKQGFNIDVNMNTDALLREGLRKTWFDFWQVSPQDKIFSEREGS